MLFPYNGLHTWLAHCMLLSVDEYCSKFSRSCIDTVFHRRQLNEIPQNSDVAVFRMAVNYRRVFISRYGASLGAIYSYR